MPPLDDALAEAAQLADRPDLGNLPPDPAPTPARPDGDADAAAEDAAAPPEPEAPEAPEASEAAEADRGDEDPVALRAQVAQMQRELELARAAYRAPADAAAPALPQFDATNILPIEIDPQMVEALGLPKEAAKPVGDLLKVTALAAKNAAVQELTAAYGQVQQQQQRAQQLRARFYGEHPELEQHADWVLLTANQVKQHFPQAPEEALLPMIAEATKQRLAANGIRLTKARTRKRRPAASDSSGSSAGVRPNGHARGSYQEQLAAAMDRFADGRRG